MNELILLLQIVVVALFSLGALKLGREALITWVTLQALLANLFVLKQIRIFSFDVTCSDAFAIGSMLGLNFIQQFFNKESAQKATRICFYFLLFFAIASLIHLFYTPSPFDSTHQAYKILLQPAPRLLIASLLSFFLVQNMDIHLFSWLRNKISSFFGRNLVSVTLTQGLDTVLFSFLGLYGLVASLGDIILVSFVLKAAITLSLALITNLARRFLTNV